jgi:hypothetical protein
MEAEPLDIHYQAEPGNEKKTWEFLWKRPESLLMKMVIFCQFDRTFAYFLLAIHF